MTRAFLQHYLFEINDNLKVEKNKTGPYEYLSIDNFYKRPEEIYTMLTESWVQSWKNNINGNNFREYFDCRSFFPIVQYGFENESKTTDYLKSILPLEGLSCNGICTNIFSWINTPPSNIQFMPHQDSSLNILIYLDKINSGGTALYEKMPHVDYPEEIDIRVDISKEKINHYVIPSFFNRCVIFDGNIPHGGFIENHSKYSNRNWRYNVVYFFEKKN